MTALTCFFLATAHQWLTTPSFYVPTTTYDSPSGLRRMPWIATLTSFRMYLLRDFKQHRAHNASFSVVNPEIPKSSARLSRSSAPTGPGYSSIRSPPTCLYGVALCQHPSYRRVCHHLPLLLRLPLGSGHCLYHPPLIHLPPWSGGHPSM